MSALPLKAECAMQWPMSALGQRKRTARKTKPKKRSTRDVDILPTTDEVLEREGTSRSRARVELSPSASLTPPPTLVRIRESSKAAGVGPTGRPGIQIRRGSAHHIQRTARLRTNSKRSCRTNHGQSTRHHI